MLEQLTQTFGGLAQMLDSTVHAIYSSVSALAGVAEQFAHLKDYLIRLLSAYAIIRYIRKAVRSIFRLPSIPDSELKQEAFGKFQQQGSLKPLLTVVAVLGIPYLLIQASKTYAQTLKISQPGMEGMWPTGEVATVLYDFAAQTPEDLPLQKGEEVVILSKVDEMGNPSLWWKGDKGGVVGIFPANYVQTASGRTVNDM